MEKTLSLEGFKMIMASDVRLKPFNLHSHFVQYYMIMARF
jgi:hypothetical protein